VSVRDGILAILSMGPAYGLQLHSELTSRAPHRKPVNVGQIYGTLDRLAKQGLIEPAGKKAAAITLLLRGERIGKVGKQALGVAGAEQRGHLAHEHGRSAERLDHETEALKLRRGSAKARSRFAVKLNHLGDEEELPGDAAICKGALQPFIDEALVGRVLVDDDQGVFRLGDDEGVLDLRTRRAERVAPLQRIAVRHRPARVATIS
jgi:hypothetical protein